MNPDDTIKRFQELEAGVRELHKKHVKLHKEHLNLQEERLNDQEKIQKLQGRVDELEQLTSRSEIRECSGKDQVHIKQRLHNLEEQSRDLKNRHKEVKKLQSVLSTVIIKHQNDIQERMEAKKEKDLQDERRRKKFEERKAAVRDHKILLSTDDLYVLAALQKCAGGEDECCKERIANFHIKDETVTQKYTDLVNDYQQEGCNALEAMNEYIERTKRSLQYPRETKFFNFELTPGSDGLEQKILVVNKREVIILDDVTKQICIRRQMSQCQSLNGNNTNCTLVFHHDPDIQMLTKEYKVIEDHVKQVRQLEEM